MIDIPGCSERTNFKTIYVCTSDFGFIVENFRVLKFCLIKYYVD